MATKPLEYVIRWTKPDDHTLICECKPTEWAFWSCLGTVRYRNLNWFQRRFTSKYWSAVAFGARYTEGTVGKFRTQVEAMEWVEDNAVWSD